MDWITHYMLAFILGRKLGLDKNGMMALTLGSLALDFDVIFYLFPDGMVPSHGTVTHTLEGMIVIGAVATVAMYGWKKKMLAAWLGLGITSHILIDLVNTFSVFDSGKHLLYPITSSIFTLETFTVQPIAVWAVITAGLFAISIVMMAVYVLDGDAPWRVWYDERPLVAYWQGKLGRKTLQ